MDCAAPVLPVTGLDELTTESRMIATPWSRMVRGIGLGQYPVDHDPVAAGRIRHTFDLLAAKVPPSNSYTLFARRLADLILNVTDPAVDFTRVDVGSAAGDVVDAVRSEGNAYYRVTAGCILMAAFAKLGLDRKLLVNEWMDFPAEILAATDRIRPDRIKDENSGRHGDYERLSAYTAVFLAFGQLGMADRLVTGERNHVREALDLLERIPAPFFRGRGGSMLLSAISLLGFDEHTFDGPRDYLKETLDHLDRADELAVPPAFPQPMSEDFGTIYPLLTMLNAIAMAGRPEYLTYRKDRLAEAKDLLGRIDPVERTHMGLYYLVALHNLGRLSDEVPDLNAFVEDVLGQWDHADPGANFFRNGIAYPYMIETAMLTGRMDLITDEGLDRLVGSYPDLDRTDLDRVNRPYPFSYALNMLGEIGEAGKLYTPSARYGGRSAVAWVTSRLSDGGRAEGNRLYMLDHALIGYALRMRGRQSAEPEVFRNFRFPLTA